MRKLRDLIRMWWPRGLRLALGCMLLALMSSCYRPAPRAKTGRASLMCGPCVVPTPSGAVLVGDCEEGWCDELV